MIARTSIRGAITSAARTVFRNVPVGAWERIFPKDVIALCYHMVSDERLPHMRLYDYKSSHEFERDVLFAKSRSISYDELLKIRTTDKKASAHRFFFTFDDGFAECYTVIRPILLRHSVDAAFFVVTDYLDDREPFVECRLSLLLEQIERADDERLAAVSSAVREFAIVGDREETAEKRMATARFTSGGNALRVQAARAVLGLEADDRSALEACGRILGVGGTADGRQIFLSREQVRQLSNDGFTIVSHARQHRLLEYRGIGEIEDEIVASCEEVRRITGQSHVPFAFPYRGVNVDRQKIAEIMSRHPWIELIFDSGYMRRDPPFIVNRVFNDTPSTDAESNIPGVLREAWSSPSAWHRV